MFYKWARPLIYVYLRLMFRIEVKGADNIPQEGGVIICANHVNAHDPLMIALGIRRRPFFLGKKELFENRVLRRLFIELGAYPVDRNTADLRAYKWAMGILGAGGVLGLFAQGTRGGGDAKNGVALFALKARVPVVPCGISGSYRLFSKVRLNFGEAVRLDGYYGVRPERELLERITAEIMERVRALGGEAV